MSSEAEVTRNDGGEGWTTSNNVTVVPKTAVSNGYRGTISGTNRGDRPTDMPMNFVTCDRLLAKTDLRSLASRTCPSSCVWISIKGTKNKQQT